MNIKCEVIRDLLPLYVDEVVSEESRELIEEHLKECEECRASLSLLREDLPEAANTDFADEAASLRKIKRRMIRNRILIVMITLGFAIAAMAVIGAMKLTDYSGSLEENVSYQLPAGYEEVTTTSTDPANYKEFVRETTDTKETIILYYNGLIETDFTSQKDIIQVDPSTEVEINAFDWSHDRNNELYCLIHHGDEEYIAEYRCKQLDKDNYYASCSKAQQEGMLAFIETFDYHRPANDAGGSIFSRLHHNLGTGGCIVLALAILFFIGIPIAIGISGATGSSGSKEDAVISSRDLHESMNREREARGEESIPAINNVQGASSNNLARRDHSWNSVPDFFIKLFRKK